MKLVIGAFSPTAQPLLSSDPFAYKRERGVTPKQQNKGCMKACDNLLLQSQNSGVVRLDGEKCDFSQLVNVWNQSVETFSEFEPFI